MQVFLETERLVLRRFTLDSEALVTHLLQNHPRPPIAFAGTP